MSDDMKFQYVHEYTEMDGSKYRRRVSEQEFRERKPDGHVSDGTPYWNYTQKRRKVGRWESIEPNDDTPKTL